MTKHGIFFQSESSIKHFCESRLKILKPNDKYKFTAARENFRKQTIMNKIDR